MSHLTSRKFIVALIGIGAAVVRPEAGLHVAAIAVAFFGAHSIADWKNGKPSAPA